MSIQLLTPSDQVGYEFLNFLQKSANLFNKSTITAGYYIQNGNLYANEDFWCSDFIPVSASTQYTRSFKADKYFNWYNSAKTFISGGQTGATLMSPSGAAFFRVSCRYQEFTPEVFMFCEGASVPATYLPYYSNINDLFNVESRAKALINRFYGKKLAVLGDSITYGFIPRNNQLTFGTISSSGTTVSGTNTAFTAAMVGSSIVCDDEVRAIAAYTSASVISISSAFSADKSNAYYSVRYNNYSGQLFSYAYWLSRNLNMTLYNYGISGSFLGLLNGNNYNAMETRYTGMEDTADLIIVMGGTNDIRGGGYPGMPLGTMADRTEYTWYGALHRLIQGLIKKYYINQGLEKGRTKQIVFSTMLHNGVTYDYAYTGGTFKQFAEAEKIVCAYYGIPCYDMMSESGIAPHEFRIIRGWQDGYTDLYNPFIPDGTHPTELAHKMMAEKFTRYLLTL
jgi:lysophospholipase L1-like esterase